MSKLEFDNDEVTTHILLTDINSRLTGINAAIVDTGYQFHVYRDTEMTEDYILFEMSAEGDCLALMQGNLERIQDVVLAIGASHFLQDYAKYRAIDYRMIDWRLMRDPYGKQKDVCPKCGKPIRPQGQKYCMWCGVGLKWEI